ncbi:hypothetical protein GDO81_024176 [Engystomops pustulosus]|uniref:Uncharacterized protein n=1 Tax=Engystomops pustulosus TaxID=76066 RepID=A0AAV6YKD2_ENGPU|nr:hypothetical protein GDO81_024176 [Engystomops pustulosus]
MEIWIICHCSDCSTYISYKFYSTNRTTNMNKNSNIIEYSMAKYMIIKVTMERKLCTEVAELDVLFHRSVGNVKTYCRNFIVALLCHPNKIVCDSLSSATSVHETKF